MDTQIMVLCLYKFMEKYERKKLISDTEKELEYLWLDSPVNQNKKERIIEEVRTLKGQKREIEGKLKELAEKYALLS